jgi:hypothetical protein
MEQDSQGQNQQQPEGYRYWTNPAVAILGSVGVFFFAQIIAGLVALGLGSYLPGKTYQLVTIMGLSLLILLSGVSFLKSQLKFGWRAVGFFLPRIEELLLAIPAYVVYFVASFAMALVASTIPGFKSDQVQDTGFSGVHGFAPLAAAFIGLVIITPIFEETIFRGLLFKGLRRRLPFWASAAIASLIFAVAHMQWNVALDVFALSMVLCYLVERSQSTLPGMLLHALKNTLAFWLLFIHK